MIVVVGCCFVIFMYQIEGVGELKELNVFEDVGLGEFIGLEEFD